MEHSANVKLYAEVAKQKKKSKNNKSHPGNTLDDNHELFALGLANIFGGLFSAYATGGGFSRTAINVKASLRQQQRQGLTGGFESKVDLNNVRLKSPSETVLTYTFPCAM